MDKWERKRALTNEELLRIIEEDDLDDYMPLDNSPDTDVEPDEDEDENYLEDNVDEIVIDEIGILENGTFTQPLSLSVTEEKSEEPEPNRSWVKQQRETKIPDYIGQEGLKDDELFACHTPTELFLKLLGDAVTMTTFQSNLYATQKGRNLKLDEKELLTFIGINFLMGYHQLPSLANYWSTSEDLAVPIVAKAMSRNRFQDILSNLHINDNSLLDNKNKDKIYKVRPLLDCLNKEFSAVYYGTRILSVDESMIRFKGRSSIKQYNPMKPIKRGYKLWCLADQHGFVKKFDVYQGKYHVMDAKYKEYGLGEKVVLFLTEKEWGKNKIVYFDNFFNSIKLLEKLKLEKTLACGTINSKRIGTPRDLRSDKDMKRGDFDFRVSNTGVSYYKWVDNRVVHTASNFHGSETVEVERKQKDGHKIKVAAPATIKDYNAAMGGVDLHDQLRSSYHVNRRSKKWWHRLFWGFLDIAFVNSYVIGKHYLKMDECKTLLSYRRDVALGLIKTSENIKKRPSSSGSTSTVPKKRRYNYSVPVSVRLGNVGSHWARFSTKRGRCEMCSAKAIQSKPHSLCSTCGVFLCVNEKKNCFSEYHEVF